MSTTATQSETCKACGTDFGRGYQRGYCTEKCWFEYKGEKAINLLRYNHVFCTCGRRLKDTIHPGEEWSRIKSSAYETVLANGGELHNVDGKIALDATQASDRRPSAGDAVIGFQTRTKHAETVEKEFEGPDKYVKIYRTGTGCECGITDTRDKDETLQMAELATVLANYVKIFKELYNEGQLDKEIDKDIFFNTFKDSRNIEYSLGKALYHGG